MANILQTISMSLKDFRILPGYTDTHSGIKNVSLRTKLCIKDNDYLYLNIPFVSAAMQAVTGTELATALSLLGGVGVLPVSQSIEEQCTKLNRIKRHTADIQKQLIDTHIIHPESILDSNKRLCVGAAISTHPEDRERASELIRNEADFIVIDASDGCTVYQLETLKWLKAKYDIPVIAGNVVTKESFLMLAENGADAVKIGMGAGSGCTTQEVKATGRGQATAIMEIAEERDAFFNTEYYIPLIADGSIITSSDAAVALALGADSVMMGNFFAGMTESNSNKIKDSSGKYYKEYWMEGTIKAFNNRRYDNTKTTFFEEGISGVVNHSGSIYDILPEYANRLKATLSTTGVNTIDDFHKNAVLEKVSSGTKADSRVNNVFLKN